MDKRTSVPPANVRGITDEINKFMEKNNNQGIIVAVMMETRKAPGGKEGFIIGGEATFVATAGEEDIHDVLRITRDSLDRFMRDIPRPANMAELPASMVN